MQTPSRKNTLAQLRSPWLCSLSCAAVAALLATGCDDGEGKSSPQASVDADRKQDTGASSVPRDSAAPITPDGGVRPPDGRAPSPDTDSPKTDAQAPDLRSPSGDGALPSDTQPRPDTQPGNMDSGGSTGAAAPQFQGRFDLSDTSTPGAASFGWTGSAIVARFQGTSIDVGLESANQFAVVIDGKLSPVLKPTSGTKKYTLATGLAAGPHDVVLWQRSENNWSADRFTGFTVPDGALLAPPRLDRRIEVYGDSITAGYGIEGKGPNCSYSQDNSNSYLAYAAVTARALGAELHSVAWSGIGMYRNYGEKSESPENMPAVYARTTPTGKNLAGKALAPWDFASWQPHAVIINLGTNDTSTNGDPGAGYHDNYLKFVTTLRERYPQTFFVLAAGPMLGSSELKIIKGYLQTIIKERASAGDSKMSYLEFPTQDANDGLGCDWHPGVTTNTKMSALLVAELKKQLGW